MAELSEAELEEIAQKANRATHHSPDCSLRSWPYDKCNCGYNADKVTFPAYTILRLIAELRGLRTKVERLEGEVAEAIERSEVSHDDA